MLSKVKNADHDDSIPKYRLFSAHDTNIGNWLAVLGVPFTKIEYADNIFMELYINSEE